MPEETAVAPKRKYTKKAKEIVVTPVQQICQWCDTVIVAGQAPAILGTCAKCQKIEATFEAEEPCEHCGGRKAISVAGIKLKDGHRDSCLTRAEDPTPRRKLTEEQVNQILQQLGPAPVRL